MKKDWKLLAAFAVIFLVAYFLPLGEGNEQFEKAVINAFKTLQWYAREHTLPCVVPALFIAGAITTFLSKEAVLRYLGPKAHKGMAYLVASVSGTILAVCSCSVLPMFAGIYRVGAGLGPASTFLYAGPAINVLAVFLTARVLGFQLGIARAIGAIVFGVIIGLVMALVFHKDEQQRTAVTMQLPHPRASTRRPWQTVLFFACMIAFLVFSDWYNPGEATVETRDGTKMQIVLLRQTRDEILVQVQKPIEGYNVGEKITLRKSDVSVAKKATWVNEVHQVRWHLAGSVGLAVLGMAWRWFDRQELIEWMDNTWTFAKLLVPLLFGGVFVVGFLGALLPEDKVAAWVGDNSLAANLVASVIGCLFYFATLTEIPILEALVEHGMAQGPALALLLAGPALSIPSILVIRSVIGNTKTVVFTALVVVMATAVGISYGVLVGEDSAQAMQALAPPLSVFGQ